MFSSPRLGLSHLKHTNELFLPTQWGRVASYPKVVPCWTYPPQRQGEGESHAGGMSTQDYMFSKRRGWESSPGHLGPKTQASEENEPIRILAAFLAYVVYPECKLYENKDPVHHCLPGLHRVHVTCWVPRKYLPNQ